MDDDDDLVLAGVPDDAAVIQDESLLLEDMDDAVKEARPRASAGAEPDDSVMEAETSPTDLKLPKRSGKRKIIQHSWPADLPFGIDPNSEEEKAKREARAAKFGGGGQQ